MKRLMALLLPLLALGILTGCATIFNNGYIGLVEISSEPEGARVSVMGGLQSCQTPCRLPLPMDRDHRIEAHYPGYQDKSLVAERRVAGVFWLNALLGVGGLGGALFDWFTDSMWVLKRQQVRMVLAANPTAPGETPAEPPETPPVPEGYQLQTLDSPDQKPPESPTLNAVRQRYPEDDVMKRIKDEYGVLAPEEKKRIADRLYGVMVEMQEKEKRLDLDEAIRRDRSTTAKAGASSTMPNKITP